MKTAKRLCAIALVLTLAITVFAACGKKPTVQEQLVGSWRDSSGVLGLDLNADGTGNIVALDIDLPIISSLKGEFKITYTVETSEEGVTTLHVKLDYVLPINLDFTITLNEDILTLKHSTGLSYTLTRQTETDTTAPASDAVSE